VTSIVFFTVFPSIGLHCRKVLLQIVLFRRSRASGRTVGAMGEPAMGDAEWESLGMGIFLRAPPERCRAR